MALLECQYELEDDALYSVKWYKDDEEFYRYVPKSSPAQISYTVDGIKVDHHLSNDKQVVLRSVNLKSSGVYRCEVSAEAPSFASAQREGRMDIVFLPKDGPHISGQERPYQIGDEISLNCTSGRSYPASVLHWYINDHEEPSPGALVHFPHVVHPHGLVTSSLGLRFKVLSQHFLGGSMRLRCVAKVSPTLWQGDRESVVSRATPDLGLDTVREALFLVKGSSNVCSASAVVVAALTTLALATTT